MTGKERITNILQHKPVDRIGIYENFWDDTLKEYVSKGYVNGGEDLPEHFKLDINEKWAFNLTLDLDFTPVTVDETEDTITILDGNGAKLRKYKNKHSSFEHVGFAIEDFESWAEYKHFLLQTDERRIDFEGYRKIKEIAKKENQFFVWSGVNVFECMHPICGHENLLAGMALDPEWIKDMAETFADLLIRLQTVLFEKEGYPDGIWYYEDMGYKGSPFMSPEMYRELIMPYHKKTIDFAHSHNLPVIVHSCGYIEPLIPHMIEAGIDCLEAIEVKAGMDLLEIYKKYGDKIALMGGIDVRTIISNDKKVIDRELESKIPIVKEGFGYVLHSDHSIPKTVNYETLHYFFQKGIELGKY